MYTVNSVRLPIPMLQRMPRNLKSTIPTALLFSLSQMVSEYTHYDSQTATLKLSSAASVPGLLLLGYLSDHWPLRAVITLSCLGSAAACLLLWGFSTNSSVLIAFVAIFGLLGLSFSAIWAKLIGIISSGFRCDNMESLDAEEAKTFIIADDDPSLPSIIFPIFAFMRGIGNITSGKQLGAEPISHEKG